MDTKTLSFGQTRRRFLSRILPVGTLVCLGCSSVGDLSGSKEKTTVSQDQHKFLKDSGMSFKEVYEFAYKRGFIPVMQNLADDLGKENFIEMLKKAGSKSAAQKGRNTAENLPRNDLTTWTADLRKPNHFWKHVLTFDIVEDTDKAFEMKITECLWAKIFREAKASDIGYAAICYPDYAMSQAFNPKIRTIRSKTLMQGHDYCNPRWVWEG